MDQGDERGDGQHGEADIDAPQPQQKEPNPVRAGEPHEFTPSARIVVAMPGLLIVGATGPSDPTRASIPFHIAVNGARPAGTQVAIALAGDAAELIKPDVIANVVGLGIPPLRDLLDKCLDQEVPVYV